MNTLKKFLLGVLLFVLFTNLKAQNITKFEYFMDTDPGIGLATAVIPTASPTVTDFNIPISTASLTNGFHTAYIRGQNTAGTWTQTHFRVFYIVPLLAPPPTTITQMEYFVDTDPGIGLATQVTGLTPSATITNLAINLNVTSLSIGFHTLYVRSKTAAGDWTQTHFRVFYIVPPLAPSPTTITQVEYFVDTDPGVGSATPVAGITPSATLTNLPIDITASTYTPGFHTLYVRAKTASGNWTQTHFRNFYITSLPTASNLVKFEYFFDTDPGFDNGTAAPITPPVPSVTNQDIFAVPSSLSIGTHTIYVRAKATSGNWTQVSTGTFSVTAPAPPTIASFTPTSGPAGTMVTITGANFTGATAVTFGGTAATSFTIVSPTTITAVVGTGTSGIISVTNAAGTATSSSNFTITVPAITISPQPISTAVCNGATASFATAATGTTNITYQWQYSSDGVAAYTDLTNTGGYTNVATATLSVNTNGNFGAGFYHCKINGDLVPTVFTNPVQLTVNAIPVSPTATGANVCSGASASLSASGGSNGQYVWYTVASGGTAIAGQVNSTYTTPSLTATTTYYVSISNGTCESARTSVIAAISFTGCSAPVITVQPLATQIGGMITLNLVPLISTPNSTLDLTSLAIVSPPTSGAKASISPSGVLTIDYTGIRFSGTENISIKACDTNDNCATQQFSIDVAGDIIVYNGISPNGVNPKLILQYIDVLPDTKNNSVYIFDSWENQVWHGNNYDNLSVVFTGISDGGSDLPTGVYFYKIIFNIERKSLTGFISLRRQ